MKAKRLAYLLFLVLLAGSCGQHSKPAAAAKQSNGISQQQSQTATNDWKTLACDVVTSKKESFEAVKNKAEKGDARYQCALAECYFSGFGTVTNLPESLKWFCIAATNGFSEAQFELSLCYADTTPPNTNAAVFWADQAAANGYAFAQLFLGTWYAHGWGVPADQTQSVIWYRKAAEQGVPDAENDLGYCYQSGTGIAQDLKEAVDWYRRAAEQGLAVAQENLAICYSCDSGVTQDETNAARWFQAAATNGLAQAQFTTGYIYEHGLGVPQDMAKAIGWYRKAAEQGNTGAELRLGLCYANGQGLPKNAAESAKWLRRAAEQGTATQQMAVAVLFYYGMGVPQDHAEAAKWFRNAAEQGDMWAEYVLAADYAGGDGVAQDYSQAVKLYKKAAEQGLVNAQYSLGLIYDNGEGVPQDYAEAFKWYSWGANQGDAGCQNNLGVMYQNGEGVPQDYVEAYKWYNLAAAQGETNAIQNRGILINSMTSDQIAQAQEMSRNFQPDLGFVPDKPNSVSPENPKASGTGFFITDDGYLISNYHVIQGATKVCLLTRTGIVDAQVVQVDAANDLALLKAAGRFDPLPVAPSRGVQLGSTVATVGFPDPGLQGFSPKLAKGEIASLSGAQDDVRYFQISVPVQPGNSGGALVDEHGNVVGIVSAKLDEATALAASGALPENVNYAIKSSFLLSFLESVPDVDASLKAPDTKDEKFEDVVKDTEAATALVLVY